MLFSSAEICVLIKAVNNVFLRSKQQTIFLTIGGTRFRIKERLASGAISRNGDGDKQKIIFFFERISQASLLSPEAPVLMFTVFYVN